MRRTLLSRLKHRPKTVSVEPGSNRHLEAPILAKAKDIFACPEFPGKRVLHNWRFFIRAGKAATGPPVGQEFSKLGLKVMDFTKAFNDRTKPLFKDDVDLIVRIQVYFDKAYTYRIEPPPTAWFLLRAVRKKRRETGPVPIKGVWCCYITLEMIYEIAKMKQFNWSRWDSPIIEERVQKIALQARRMGVCVLGVDTVNQPVKGLTDKQYEAECAKYREIHKQQHAAIKEKELLEAPLIERLHRPNLNELTPKQLEEGLADPRLFQALWTATNPKNPYTDQKSREVALKYMNTRQWFKDMTAEELRVVFASRAVGEKERHRQVNGDPSAMEPYWGRDAP